MSEALTILPPQVPVSLGEKFPTDDQAVEALRRLGFSELNTGVLSDEKLLGEHLQGVGTVRMGQRKLLIAQHKLDAMIDLLMAEAKKCADIEKPKERHAALCKLTHECGYVTSKRVEAIALMMQPKGQSTPHDTEEEFRPTVKSFAPGAEVKPNQTLINAQQVHFHGGEAPATAK